MQNLVLGILTVFCCLIVYYFSFRAFRKNNYGHALVFIILGGLLLRIYVSTDLYLHEWDERYHALVAKNLIDHPLKPTLYDKPVFPTYPSAWTSNHIWLEKGPVPLWNMALFLKIFGTNVFSLRIPSLILSLLAVYLTYLIGSVLFNKKIGVLAAFFHSIHGLIIELAAGRVSSDHVETFFIFFVELGIYLAVLHIVRRKGFYWPVLIGFVTGLAFLSKWSPSLLVFPVWTAGLVFVGNYNRKEIFTSLFVGLVCFLFTVAPWITYIYMVFPEEARWISIKFLHAYTGIIEEHTGLWYFYLEHIGMIFGALTFVPLFLAIYHMVKKRTDWKLWLLNTWWIIPVLVFSFAETKRHTYLLIASPSFFILTAYYWFYLYDSIKTFKYQWLIYLTLALLLVFPVMYSNERVKPFQIRDRNPKWSVDLKKFAREYHFKSKKVVVFNLDHPIEAMFYTPFTVYAILPTEDDIIRLGKEGYTIVINDSGINKNDYKRYSYVKLVPIGRR